MGSHAAQLCLRSRSLLHSVSLASTVVPRCTTASSAASRILSGSSLSTRNHRPTETGRRWKQQMLYYSDLSAQHLATEAKELSRTAVVEYRSPPGLDTVAELSALKEIDDQEAISISPPADILPGSDSLSDYVDKSETLTKLVQLGVALWRLEKRPNVGSMLLRLDFGKDVAPRLLFLKGIGMEESCFGYLITNNPFILTERVENLQTRVNYLQSMKFSPETIASMVSRAPYLLNFSVKRLDNRLAFYQQELKLSASNTRNVIARLPKLLCCSLEPVKENLKVLQIELGFKEKEIQHIVLAIPKVLLTDKRKLTQIFEVVHITMKVPHHLITKFPMVLNSRYFRIRERHLFLEYLGKAQYDPNLPNYISLDRLVCVPNETFCTELASATVEDFYRFQKTI